MRQQIWLLIGWKQYQYCGDSTQTQTVHKPVLQQTRIVHAYSVQQHSLNISAKKKDFDVDVTIATDDHLSHFNQIDCNQLKPTSDRLQPTHQLGCN